MAQSTFPRTMLEMTLIRMATLRPVLPIEEILKKLEGLERKGPPIACKDPIRRARSHVQSVTVRGRPDERRNQGSQPLQDLKEPRKEETPPSKKPENPVDSQDRSLPRRRSQQGESPKAVEEVWRELVDFTRARNPVLGSFLAFGDLIHLSDDKIEIGFEKDSFHYERMMETENRSQLGADLPGLSSERGQARHLADGTAGKTKRTGRLQNAGGDAKRSGESRWRKGRRKPLIRKPCVSSTGRIVEG